MNCVEQSERFIPYQRASKLNYQIKRENMRLNDHSMNLINSLFSEECENVSQQTAGTSNNKEMKVLSFCGPYTSRDKRLASRCGREDKKSKKSKIEYKLSQQSILDAPGVVDNWYYSLMSWNHITNKIAVALSEEIYLYDFSSKKIKRVVPAHDILMDGPNAMKIVTSIEWMKGKGNDLVYGDVLGNLQVIDHVVGRRLRKLNGRGIGSIYCLASRGEHLVTAGTRDGKLLHHDLRMKNSLTSKQNMFSSITSVGWSQDGSKFACGLLDNLAYVFEDSVLSNNSYSLPLHTLKHKSAVGNVKFNPHNNNLLATAGGIFDKSVRFFEVSSGHCLNEVNAYKQVCDVAWVNDKLMISAENDIMLLSSKSKKPLFVYSTSGSKENRILSLCASKDSQFVCTLNRDEQFNFYEFESSKKESKGSALWDLQLMR